MAGIALLAMAAGAIGWKMRGFIQKKRVRTEMAQLQSILRAAHTMAVNMQADWEGVLKNDGKCWTFEAFCLDPYRIKILPPVKVHAAKPLFDGRPFDRLRLLFSSTGAVVPTGALEFVLEGKNTGEWILPDLFGIKEGNGEKDLGPLHPENT